MTVDAGLRAAVARSVTIYESMSVEQKTAHDYEQQRSFARGLCPYTADYGEWCKAVDRVLPPNRKEVSTDADG